MPAASTTSMLPLRETEVGAWSRIITANIFIWATLVVVALSTAVYVPITFSGDIGSGVFGLVIIVVVAVPLASFIRLRITVDWRGLRIVSLLLHIPLKRIPLNKIRAVETMEIRPSEWGCWGYRIMPGRSALVLRAGPGMVVTNIDGKQFAITLDDPETPAALLNTLGSQPSDVTASLGGPR
ncbi:hypothetical protein BL254_22905 [Protofrankia sp. BMG5.30]|nr:hypothetical protein BL254_22905 [Protofrankia sp. BMG5.30]